MKRTLFKSSSLKITSAFAIAAMLGGSAFAGPDNPKEKTEETQVQSERIVVEESTAVDATVMPNDAPSAESKTAEDIAASWSLESATDDVIVLPETELEGADPEVGDIVIDSPDKVVISNPDAVIETEETSEDTPDPEN